MEKVKKKLVKLRGLVAWWLYVDIIVNVLRIENMNLLTVFSLGNGMFSKLAS